jgi:hypothetical protein
LCYGEGRIMDRESKWFILGLVLLALLCVAAWVIGWLLGGL